MEDDQIKLLYSTDYSLRRTTKYHLATSRKWKFNNGVEGRYGICERLVIDPYESYLSRIDEDADLCKDCTHSDLWRTIQRGRVRALKAKVAELETKLASLDEISDLVGQLREALAKQGAL